jgi:hypothetical protein
MYLANKKAGTIKGIFDIHIIDVYLTSARCSAWVYDIGTRKLSINDDSPKPFGR